MKFRYIRARSVRVMASQAALPETCTVWWQWLKFYPTRRSNLADLLYDMMTARFRGGRP
jgi:hypothetical protein